MLTGLGQAKPQEHTPAEPQGNNSRGWQHDHGGTVGWISTLQRLQTQIGGTPCITPAESPAPGWPAAETRAPRSAAR